MPYAPQCMSTPMPVARDSKSVAPVKAHTTRDLFPPSHITCRWVQRDVPPLVQSHHTCPPMHMITAPVEMEGRAAHICASCGQMPPNNAFPEKSGEGHAKMGRRHTPAFGRPRRVAAASSFRDARRHARIPDLPTGITTASATKEVLLLYAARYSEERGSSPPQRGKRLTDGYPHRLSEEREAALAPRRGARARRLYAFGTKERRNSLSENEYAPSLRCLPSAPPRNPLRCRHSMSAWLCCLLSLPCFAVRYAVSTASCPRSLLRCVGMRLLLGCAGLDST